MAAALTGRYFVTGTDTEIGKTWVSCRLLQQAASQGASCYGLKPVAAGCQSTPDGWHNEDALALMQAASLDLPYELVNPVALQEPIAPHLAAASERRRISVDRLAGILRGTLHQYPAELVLVVGAGGWRVPLNERESWCDLVRELNLPVILVVGMKLGCINHALLSAEAIRRDGAMLAGWVANDLGQPMPMLEENLATLEAWLPAPRLLLE